MGIFQERSKKCKTGEVIKVRTAVESDALSLNSLVEEIFKTSDFLITSPEEFSSFTEDQQKERINKYLKEDGHLLLVAQYQDQFVGTLDFQNGKRKKISHKGSFGMSVLKDWRNRGVGEFLLQSLIDWAKMHPFIEIINLGVLEENVSAITLYTKKGFEKIGEDPFGVKLSQNHFIAEWIMSLRIPK